jgi:hypothetical protein
MKLGITEKTIWFYILLKINEKIIPIILTLIISFFSIGVNAQGLGDLIDSLGSEITF